MFASVIQIQKFVLTLPYPMTNFWIITPERFQFSRNRPEGAQATRRIAAPLGGRPLGRIAVREKTDRSIST